MMNSLLKQKIDNILEKSVYKSRFGVYNKSEIIALFF